MNFVYEVNREEPVESMNMVDDNGDDNHQTAKSWSGTKGQLYVCMANV